METIGGGTRLDQSRGAFWPTVCDGQTPRNMQLQAWPKTDSNSSYVPCLMSHAMLAPLCFKAGCLFNIEPCHTNKTDIERLLPLGQGIYPDEFEIEEIIDHKTVNGSTLYFIKWKDWDHEYNTWEPRENLEHSHKLLDAYDKRISEINRLKRKYGDSYFSIMERKKKVIQIIKEANFRGDFATLLKMYDDSQMEFQDKKLGLKNLANILLNSANDLEKPKNKNTGNSLVSEFIISDEKFSELEDYARKRIEVLRLLKLWEKQINSFPSVSAPVKVENHFDMEGPPENFSYITDYKPSEGIIISDDPPIGCTCSAGCYDNRKGCCPALSSSEFAYNRNGTLIISQGNPIYECNKRCSCGFDCPNRVVQKGRSIPLCIFRTNNGRGWGVKTLERIKKGTFVVEYVGEVITGEEAERRTQVNEENGNTYMFDLDFDHSSEYIVDAGHYGNVAHFINHSCDPNLGVFVVWINNLDPKIPILAFFSIQEVKKGEELTFNYSSPVTSGAAGGHTSPNPGLNTSSSLGSPGVSCEENATTPNKLRKIDSRTSSADAEGNARKQIACKCGTDKCVKFF